MSDLLYIAGIALMALSVLMALVAVAQTRPPRAAASTFLLGLLLMIFAAWIDPDAFRVQDIGGAFDRVFR